MQRVVDGCGGRRAADSWAADSWAADFMAAAPLPYCRLLLWKRAGLLFANQKTKVASKSHAKGFCQWVGFVPWHGNLRPTGIDKNQPIRGAEFSACTQEFEAFNIGQVLF